MTLSAKLLLACAVAVPLGSPALAGAQYNGYGQSGYYQNGQNGYYQNGYDQNTYRYDRKRHRDFDDGLRNGGRGGDYYDRRHESDGYNDRFYRTYGNRGYYGNNRGYYGNNGGYYGNNSGYYGNNNGYYGNGSTYGDPPYREQRGGVGPGKGAAIGAAGGAVLGTLLGGGLKGAIVGGAAGAGIGAAIGEASQKRRSNEEYYPR